MTKIICLYISVCIGFRVGNYLSMAEALKGAQMVKMQVHGLL